MFVCMTKLYIEKNTKCGVEGYVGHIEIPPQTTWQTVYHRGGSRGSGPLHPFAINFLTFWEYFFKKCVKRPTFPIPLQNFWIRPCSTLSIPLLCIHYQVGGLNATSSLQFRLICQYESAVAEVVRRWSLDEMAEGLSPGWVEVFAFLDWAKCLISIASRHPGV